MRLFQIFKLRKNLKYFANLLSFLFQMCFCILPQHTTGRMLPFVGSNCYIPLQFEVTHLQTLLNLRCDSKLFLFKLRKKFKSILSCFDCGFCISAQNRANVAVCWFTSGAELKCSRCKREATGFPFFFKRIGSKADA